jgi:hypothetical protein
MKPLHRLLLVLTLALPALALTTFVVGETVPLGTLYTRDGGGELHATKLWVVQHRGVLWVRAARPGRAWFAHLEANPEVDFERSGVRASFRAVPHREPETRAAVDRAFRAQNGAIDWWYGVVLRSDAVPIELVPKR